MDVMLNVKSCYHSQAHAKLQQAANYTVKPQKPHHVCDMASFTLVPEGVYWLVVAHAAAVVPWTLLAYLQQVPHH